MLIDGAHANESAAATVFVSDKYRTGKLLRDAGVRAPRSEVVRSAGRAHELAQAWQCPLVIKPRSGNKGRGVFVNLTTPESITSAFESVHALGNDVLVEEFVQPFEEYRCIATAAECLSVVRRVLPHVVGDGQSTIAELIAEKNEERRRSPHLMKSLIPLDDVARSHLARQGSDPESVLPMGRAVTVRDVGGLSSGGDTVECSEEVPASLKDTASAAVASIPGCGTRGSTSLSQLPETFPTS
ncbi:ATP-grasp domain-containing protein [Nesterenkonia pannonica]|uniref:ATP-grasp domain-containing protein n=1 Tax=Nesterenkonia pannonica TaxID=1548602 RepID=UPI002164CEE5|nr:ATP-grasp domain-containing protein [Nesterenkonia pannonica]